MKNGSCPSGVIVKRDVLGTAMLSMLAGHRRYAHIAALRCDAVLPDLLGMKKIVSEDAVALHLNVRLRPLAKIIGVEGEIHCALSLKLAAKMRLKIWAGSGRKYRCQ